MIPRLIPPPADGAGASGPQLLVPAYFHPATHPGDWAWLAERADQVRLVVLNIASGPGTAPDPAFASALNRLRSAGVAVAGYVDTNYAVRPARDILAELGRHLHWYQVAGVFFDRAASAAENVGHYAELARRAREMGARVVAFNHGAHPIEAYADHADLLGSFEGPWSAYVELMVPRWTRSRPPAQFFHLVHSVPREQSGAALWLAGRRRAGCAYITDHGGANPWGRLPTGYLGSRWPHRLPEQLGPRGKRPRPRNDDQGCSGEGRGLR